MDYLKTESSGSTDKKMLLLEKKSTITVGNCSESDIDSGDPDGIFIFTMLCHFSIIFP